MSRLTRIGLVGCGAIGTYLAKLIRTQFKHKARLAYVNDLDKNRIKNIRGARFADIPLLIKSSDLVIEASHASFVPKLVPEVLAQGKSVLVMSVGGLLAIPNLKKLLEKSKGNIYIPSGAIAGVDALQAARRDGLKSVTLITRKPVRALGLAPGAIKKETVLFEGNAVQAVKAFPQNINVAAVISFATLSPKKVHVKIITSPEFKRNSHEIIAEGAFGKIRTITENEPSLENPKTSALAQYSAAAMLDKIFSNLKVGT